MRSALSALASRLASTPISECWSLAAYSCSTSFPSISGGLCSHMQSVSSVSTVPLLHQERQQPLAWSAGASMLAQSRDASSSASTSSPSAAVTPQQKQPGMQTRLNVPYSRRSGTPTPAPWPVIEPVGKGGKLKWHRTLYRFPSEVAVQLQERTLTLSGRAGSVTLDLTRLDPSGLVAFQLLNAASSPQAGGPAAPTTASAGTLAPMLALASPDKARFRSFVDEVEATVRGVTTGYLVGVTVKGVGYRCAHSGVACMHVAVMHACMCPSCPPAARDHTLSLPLFLSF
jgi:hypothetical protein